jgi:hypothetical protein
MTDRDPIPPAKGKKLHEVSAKFDHELFELLNRACSIQQHRRGQLVRILVEWALPYYEKARSVEALHATELRLPKRKSKKRREKK